MAVSIASRKSQTLPLPPSCLAFCPSHSSIFVVGTYYLHPQESAEQENASQKRTGSIILSQLERRGDGSGDVM